MREFTATRRKLRLDLSFTCLLLLFLAASGTALRRAGILPPARTAAALESGTAGNVLVIDPGHGGLDGGATGEDGVRESWINLQIALRMGDLAELLGQPFRLTRETEELDYPPELDGVHDKKVWDQKRRVSLINSTPGAILCSVHQNRYPDPRPSGPQVLYAAAPGSEALGKTVHETLLLLCPENRRVPAPISDSIYLMKRVNCPAVLVECGFLSNPEEAGRLESEEYQKQLAAALLAACLQYIRNQAL